MEDAHSVVPSLGGTLDDYSWVAVYDGHGGKISSLRAAAQMLGCVRKQKEFQEYCDIHSQPLETAEARQQPELLGAAMKAAFLELDAAMRAEQATHPIGNPREDSGTTAVCVMITPTHLICANAGDSRAVYLSGGQTIALSDDHKPSNPQEKSRIEAAGGSVVGDRVDGSLALSRAIGDFSYKDQQQLSAQQQKVSPEPDITIVRRDAASDQVLVLACDGVWDVMTSERCCEFIHRELINGTRKARLPPLPPVLSVSDIISRPSPRLISTATSSSLNRDVANGRVVTSQAQVKLRWA
eukprot:COSAG05_NODE_1191_length_5573_cov_12.076361_4_plen_297_part_00